MSNTIENKKLFVLCFIFILLFTSIVKSQSQSNVHFGDSIILLRFPDDELFSAHLSSYGSYVAANVASYTGVINGMATNTFSFAGTTSQYLWDLRDSDLSLPTVHLNPYAKLQIDNSYQGAAFAFHPGEQFLAVATEQEIQLLMLPSLEVSRSLPATDETVSDRYSAVTISTRLSWSPDGSLLAILLNHEILVWNIETDAVDNYALLDNYHRVQATDTGWFINDSGLQPPNVQSFTFCTTLLETCRLYESPSPTRISPDGEIILTQMGDPFQDRKVQIWYLDENGEYRPGIQFIVPSPFCARFFSPDNQTIAARCVDDWMFWDIQRSEIVFSLPASGTRQLSWLPDGEHLIWLSGIMSRPTLRLYRFGFDEPVDELILESVPGLENIRTWLFDGSYDIRDVNRDGSRVLINLGWGALIVPIEYQ